MKYKSGVFIMIIFIFLDFLALMISTNILPSLFLAPQLQISKYLILYDYANYVR